MFTAFINETKEEKEERESEKKEFEQIETNNESESERKSGKDKVEEREGKRVCFIIKTLLNDLLKFEKKYLKNVLTCRERDDVRGNRVISDYYCTHSSTEQDHIIIDVKKVINTTITNIETVLNML